MKSIDSFLGQYPELQGFFEFDYFNPVQQECLPKIMRRDSNMIVSAPTSSGKTALFEMAILKYSHLPSPMCLYLAPIKSLCHEKYTDWKKKFRKLSVTEITGDSLESGLQGFLSSHIAVGTPEKIDYLSRQNLEYLRNIRLLLIDEIHMLNYEERGATLEAIVSRIMSLNSKVRILAVSATIPNINQVGEWLRCPHETICVFGQKYRPIKINTIVNGYPHSGNPFTFEKILNYKLLQTIRTYSESKGSLIFCPTQKGTQQSCEQIITQMRQREFIQNDKQLISLVQAAKQVSNNKLREMIPQGVAFHNASLSYQDRNIVERLFLELKVKVLCTTSTLAMGINLPARLVIIKSTQAYRGAGKGYQEYTRIEIEQMTGRAGRKPFDTEGTVVIMTQKANYQRYNSKLQLETLESQLFNHMLQHINAEISLGSIQSLFDVQSYFFNSFCYIRMKQSPKIYGIAGNVNHFIKQNCLKAIQRLSKLRIINFNNDQNQRVSPRQLSTSISKNAVQIRSIAKLIQEAGKIETQRQYLMALCGCEEIGKYTSKLQQRKVLKQINEKNKFVLKEAISTAEKKSFVLVQALLSNLSIEHWQMRRQASQILLLVKRLNYCVKTMAYEYKNFLMYYWSTRYTKYFNQRFWQEAEKKMKLQISGFDNNTKDKYVTSTRNMNHLSEAMQMTNWLHKDEKIKKSTNLMERYKNGIIISIRRDEKYGNVIVGVTADDVFADKYKGATVCVGDHSNSLYDQKYMNQNKTEVLFHFPKSSPHEYKIGIIKDGIIGFDQFYKLKGDKLIKSEVEEIQVKRNHRKSTEPFKKQTQLSFDKNKSSSFDNNKKSYQKQHQQDTVQKFKAKNQNYIHPYIGADLEQTVPASQRLQKSSQLIIAKKRKKQAFSPLGEEHIPQKKIRKFEDDEDKFKDLRKDYKWKPGFQQIPSSKESKKVVLKELKLVQSKKKDNISEFLQKYHQSKSKVNNRIKQLDPQARPRISSGDHDRKEVKSEQKEDVFNYFYNLF